MSLRKAAAALAVSGVIVGLLGSGVGAQFVSQLTATEQIDVGTFSCRIINPSDGTISGDLKSVTYNAPTINSSAPGIAPFSFTVQNNGSIDQVLTVSMTGQTGNLTSNFSDIPASPPSVTLPAGAQQVVSTGIQWSELGNTDLGRAGSMTWTISCNEPAGSIVSQLGPVSVSAIDDTGTCNNTWAEDAYDKNYTLTETGPNAYSVQSVEDGTFVSNAGQSPGACESGPDNGNTVAAGVTGTLHQVWINTLTATASPSASPDCASNNDCQGAGDYLDAVFGSGNWTMPGAWSQTGYYDAGSNGSWFDTLSGWPNNDVGDITGS